ncbi:unnamed protein product [Kluyveromyces dobzhanskii CBS 2104]|uniref:WGS project CCBQ000000000 data, contig 00017 n=1 Tax=Kluyveromyces dobzhanskii CBS 2104 TaxID=1427455 RepID=A0A0A8L653_9SACH|nr:unnamed protein product [Kluyveromyces dobzhanskii CBS 2104]
MSSSHDTPSHVQSTLAISPLFQRTGANNDDNARNNGAGNFTGGNIVGGRNNTSHITQTPHQDRSPLVQKIRDVSHLATPAIMRHNGTAGSSLLTSMTKNGLFGPALPSTLRKTSTSTETAELNSSTNDNDLDHASDEVLDVSELSSVEKLRLWRHDALMQHHYKTAEHIGDIIYSMTKDPNDAFWLAQVYYNQGSYIRAVELIFSDQLDSESIMCRYLAALCLFKLNKHEEAIDIIGDTNPFQTEPTALGNTDGGVKLESSMCLLRGRIYIALSNMDRAKECFKEAVQVDVKNYEAFDYLLSKHLLTTAEQWDLVRTLQFNDLDDNEEMIRCLYISRLSKYQRQTEIETASKVLTEKYYLKENRTVLLAEIELLNNQSKFTQCMKLCEQVLEADEYNIEVLPIYIQCLHSFGAKNKLFLLSHKLAENFPKSPVTWFAVATYYLCMGKISEARKYFSRSSIMDPSFGFSWLGFAHTYVAEGEHEQALSAYSTAARFFPGTHLPYLYLGMQYNKMDDLSLAEEYFMMAYDMCPTDPLLLNELGVVYFKRQNYIKAKKYMKRAHDAIKNMKSESKAWISIVINLGHTYRKLGEDERAVKCFKTVLESSKPNATIWCSLGFLYLRMKKIEKSVDSFHKALALDQGNQAANKLLKTALEINAHMLLDEDHPMMISSNIRTIPASSIFNNDKKRTALGVNTFDPVTEAKRLKQGISDHEGDSMDIE